MVGGGLVEEEAALVGRRQPYARVTVVWSRTPVSARPGDAALVTADGRLWGWVGGSCSQPVVVREALAALADGQPRLVRMDPPDEPSLAREGVVVAPVTCASGGSLEVFVEPRLPAPHLVVVGSSPLVRALAVMARAVGFDVAVVERDGVDPAEIDAARVVQELDLAKAGAGPDSFVVVATMGCYDEDAVEAALGSGAHYVALVGSARRGAAMRETLRDGGVAETELARVRSPAGLDLGRIPHAEIAVAVLADIVAEKARTAPPVAVAEPPSQAEEAIDPVCGMTVDVHQAADKVEHDGATYFFCASSCRRRFETNPTHYLTPT